MHQASVGFHCPECARSGRQKVVTARSLRTRPVVTMALVAANLAIFVGDMLSGPGPGSFNHWAFEGALNGPLVASGDWWRPITSGFIHAGLLHVGFNMFLLWQLGNLLEPALKRAGFAALYFMSLLGGSLLTLILDPNAFTVGASGAVFGLMGAAFIAMRSRGIDPFSTGIGPLIVLNLFITFLPGVNISIGGHIGGLIAGALGGWILWVWGPRLGKGSTLPTLLCAGIAVGLYAACLAVA
jgi:membrane associated rhomboid family serine protease